MAKMHSRKRGRSRGKKPLKPTKATWITYKPKELEMLVVKLSKEGNSSSLIGLILRDSYGIPSIHQVVGKSVSQILDEKKLTPEVPEDINALIKRANLLRKHLSKNKHDGSAKRGILLTESKIHRLGKYYKSTQRIPLTWKYVPEEVKTF